MRRLSQMILLLGILFPVHAQSPHGEELKLDCSECHTPAGWSVDYAAVSFDHNSTAFELEGSHTRTDCRMCHASLIFSEAPSTCVACHEDVHSMTVGDDCIRCHTPESWLVDNIPELHEENGFPLIGAHSSLSCVECHISETNLRFDRLGNECINCHRDDYLSTENPNHLAVGYSTNCTDCHNPLGFGWDADPIAHDFFPLVMGHDIQDCNACHTPENFAGLSPDCINCHTEDYNSTSNPSHQALGLSTDCKACHGLDVGWMPARFDQHNSYYALNGAHAQIAEDCAACHNGDYNNTPNTCVGCHQDDYNRTTSPNHAAQGFSTDCASCHSEDKWEPATFDHDGMYFPIYSGSHRGAWDECADCHTSPGDFSVFSCTICHTQSRTDRDHDEVTGYVYESNACFSCHPDGEE